MTDFTSLKDSLSRATLRAAILSVSALALTACAPASNTSATPDTAKAESAAPKNIILFVGDGMGISTITAARIFDGQSKGLDGESHSLSFESFPQVGLVKTYNSNAQVPDSAGTATAMFSGYKANIGTLNVKPQADIEAMAVGSCAGGEPTLAARARTAGKAIGVISTARLTHATPAAVYGRSIDRGFETDSRVPETLTALGCKGLARQLVEADIDLALGGGARNFPDDMLADWPGAIVRTESEMKAAGDGPLLGLFSASHMAYEADRAATEEPSLADMTSTAIDRLSKTDEDGFVLMVEAGRVDHAHHGTNAFRAMRDMQALNEAVEAALAKTGEETLIVVTADHSHVFVIQGYPTRGNPILGLVKSNEFDRESMTMSNPVSVDADGKPYTTLGYYNGPNPRHDHEGILSADEVLDEDYQQQTAIRMGSETHAGEDVAIYATGTGAERFGGVMDQDEIGQAVAALLADGRSAN